MKTVFSLHCQEEIECVIKLIGMTMTRAEENGTMWQSSLRMVGISMLASMFDLDAPPSDPYECVNTAPKNLTYEALPLHNLLSVELGSVYIANLYFTVENIAHMFGILKTNSFGDLFFLTSFFNHDCAPNVLTETEKPTRGYHTVDCSCKAIKEVKAGEELCISYIKTDLDVAARQRSLSGSFGFDCAGKRCQQELNGKASL